MHFDPEIARRILKLSNDPRRTTVRRAVFMNSIMTLFTGLNGINWLGEKLDGALFPEYRDVPLGKPVFIVAAPRSGTTFLHRLMSLDPQFTALRMYETIFNSLSGRRAVERVTAADGALARGFTPLVDRINSLFDGWEGMHDTGLNHHEEDEALWALALATPAMWIIFPEPGEFPELRFPDQMPTTRQEQLGDYYRAAIQRHLYDNPGKTLLGKNVFLPGRFQIVKRALPDARFVHIIRHPYEALASMLSLFTKPWEYTAPNVSTSGPEARAMAELMIDYYRTLHREDLRAKAAGERGFITIRYRDLIADPERRIREIYDHFELELTPDFAAELNEQMREHHSFRSNHTYSLEQFGLTEKYVYEALPEIFEHHDFER